jgi:quercetin dioxygenase-like cupin family protein
MTLDHLVRELAAEPGRWRELVRHTAAERHFALLTRDDDVEVWVVSWMDGHDTGFHDHDDSAAAIVVLEGEVEDQRLALGRAPRTTRYTAGEAFSVPPAAIHRVLHAGDRPAVTLHAYSPPLARVGAYEEDEDGLLLRHARAAGEELRPVGAGRLAA